MKRSKTAGVLAAVMAAAAMASSVGATDYGTPPDYSLPDTSQPGTLAPEVSTSDSDDSSSDSSASADSSSDSSATTMTGTSMTEMYGVSFETENTLIEDSAVEEAIASATPIVASYNEATVKAAAVAALANSTDATLTVVTKRYAIEINSSSVTEAKDVDLAIKITKDSSKKALIIRTAQSGSYGCKLKVSIPEKVYSQAGVDPSKAVIYVISGGERKAYKLSELEVDENGNIIFEIEAGGMFIIR